MRMQAQGIYHYQSSNVILHAVTKNLKVDSKRLMYNCNSTLCRIAKRSGNNDYGGNYLLINLVP